MGKPNKGVGLNRLLATDELQMPGIGKAMKKLAAILFFALVAAAPLFAREKSDVLVMNNGDRLTCQNGRALRQLRLHQRRDPGRWSKVRYLDSSPGESSPTSI